MTASIAKTSSRQHVTFIYGGAGHISYHIAREDIFQNKHSQRAAYPRSITYMCLRFVVVTTVSSPGAAPSGAIAAVRFMS